MSRSYELAIVLDPRKGEDEIQQIVDRYKSQAENAGGTIDEIDNWGKRKLAYPIQKLTEGVYVFYYVNAAEGIVWSDIERLLEQDEAVLRHLVVRTDEDLKRAERAKIKPERIHATDERAERRDSRRPPGRDGRDGGGRYDGGGGGRYDGGGGRFEGGGGGRDRGDRYDRDMG